MRGIDAHPSKQLWGEPTEEKAMQYRDAQAGIEAHALWRGVNDTIAAAARLARDTDATFVCECGSYACVQRIEATLEEYDDVRSSRRRFLLARGHEEPGVERIVDVGDRFEVTELADAPLRREGLGTVVPLPTLT